MSGAEQSADGGASTLGARADDGPGSTAPRAATVGLAEHYEIQMFLTEEAELLDEQRHTEWLGLLTDDIRYRMPVTVTTSPSGARGGLGTLDHFDEDRYALAKRVERMQGQHAWTEDPPSRTRRFVTNVRATPARGAGAGRADSIAAGPSGVDSPDAVADGDAAGAEFDVSSYLLLFRSRLDVRPTEWVSCRRRDLLRRVEGGLRLARRDIEVDEAVLRTQNLAVFL